ncbi:Hemolysin activation/secretion protein [Cribrihabitans marinus]|uniref:Hemolysin activation/secretion protein n=1 Tax=Cribrihabitans marinus TaxID=1227549 RepID=A0A1H7DTK4_9RHOB|nr:ShlB/FhaC/HecB family hemolysin secretion/activation protein [Cribrihabitans marinus]SEK02630.1 Hemolysin activation/secretion protein [Cribrihabitans marinus]
MPFANTLSPRTVVLAGVLSLLAQAGLAQTASNIAPSTFQPENRQATSAPVTVARDPGADTPAGSDRLFVTVGAVDLRNPLPQMRAANERFRATLAGKRVPASEIFRAVRELEAAYAEAGFVLARVVLPQQTVRDGGTVRVEVVNGFVERIDSSAVPDPVRARVAAITAPLVGRPGLRIQQIERALLLAGDTYGVRLASTLATGQQSGGTALILDGQYKRVTGSYGLDNTLSDELGPFNLSMGLELNGALEMGETFYGRLGGAPQDYFSSDPQYRIAALGAVVPIGLDGLTFNVEGTLSQSNPDDALVPTTSQFDRLSLRLYYPWIRSRAFNLTSQFILDRQNDEQELKLPGGNIPIYRDELTVLRASLDAGWQFDSGAYLRTSAILSQGIDALGARSAAEAAGNGVPLSRQGADDEFTKLVVGVSYDRPLSPDWSLSLRGRIQENFGDPLLTSEQFSIAGAGELSTFDAGSVKGDDGWVMRAEVAHQSRMSLGGIGLIVKPYLFGAYGEVGLEQPTIVEQGSTTATSYGVGIELLTIEESDYSNATLRLEYGRGERDDNEPDDDRFSIVASRRF